MVGPSAAGGTGAVENELEVLADRAVAAETCRGTAEI